MELKLFFTVCITVFLAELGDKTQFAIMAFGAQGQSNPWVIFAGASLGFVASAGFGVLLGHWLSGVASVRALSFIAGGTFILIGGVTVFKAWNMEV